MLRSCSHGFMPEGPSTMRPLPSRHVTLPAGLTYLLPMIWPLELRYVVVLSPPVPCVVLEVVLISPLLLR